MVRSQIMARGISDPRVLDVMRRVPRDRFAPDAYLDSAYDDHPLPIGEGQTISQPYMVALMTQSLSLKGDERVLEIGTGSGYQAAILAELARDVYSIERIEILATRARKLLKKLNYQNIEIIVGDGSKGLPEKAPFDGIIVTASAPDVPQVLVDQLSSRGRIVIPVGGTFSQDLVLVEKVDDKVVQTVVCGCVFVPLIGEHGWQRSPI